MRSGETRGILPLFLIFLFVFLYTSNDLATSSTSYIFDQPDRTMTHILLIVLIWLIAVYYLLFLPKSGALNFPVRLFICMDIYTVIILLFASNNAWTVATYGGFILWWIFTVLMTKSYLSKYPDNAKYISFFCMLMFIFYCYKCVHVYLFANQVTSVDYATLNIIYRILVFMPIICMLKKRFIRFAALAVIGILTLMSMKRGALLSYPCMLIAYIYISNRIGQKNNALLFKVVAVIILIITAIIIADKLTDGWISYRFSPDQLRFASGRLERWNSAWHVLKARSLSELLFGSGVHISLHNEWFEFLYVYGLIGFVMISAFTVKLVTRFIALYRSRSPYAAAYGTIIMYFSIIGLTSGFFFMHGTFYIMLCLGMINFFSPQEKRLPRKDPGD